MVIWPDENPRDYIFEFTSDTTLTLDNYRPNGECESRVRYGVIATGPVQFDVILYRRFRNIAQWPNPPAYVHTYRVTLRTDYHDINGGGQIFDTGWVGGLPTIQRRIRVEFYGLEWTTLPCRQDSGHIVAWDSVKLYVNESLVAEDNTPINWSVPYGGPARSWGVFEGTPFREVGTNSIVGFTHSTGNSIGGGYAVLDYTETSRATWRYIEGVTTTYPDLVMWPSPTDPDAACGACSPKDCDDGLPFPDAHLEPVPTTPKTTVYRETFHICQGGLNSWDDFTSSYAYANVITIDNTSPISLAYRERAEIYCCCNQLSSCPSNTETQEITNPDPFCSRYGKLIRRKGVLSNALCLREVNVYNDLLVPTCYADGNDTDPSNLGTPGGETYRAYIKNDDVFFKHQWDGVPVEFWQGESQVTTTADCSKPCVLESPISKRLYIVYLRSGLGSKVKYSDDDGLTWSAEVSLFADGTIPRCASNLVGDVLFASFKYDSGSTGPGKIRGIFRGVGDASNSSQFTFKDSTNTDISFTDDGFDICDVKDPQNRWMLTARKNGDTVLKEWWSADDGLTWTEV